MFREQITELVQLRLVEMDEMIHSLKERNESLEAQLMEKDKTIGSLPQVCSQLLITFKFSV